MERRKFLHAAGAAAAAGPFGSAVAQAKSEPAIESALRERVKHEGVGFAAAVVGSTGIAFHAAGTRTADGRDTPDADSFFEYGSTTKTFTALLLADMALRKELALDEPVEAALGGAQLRDSTGKPITWADLATHRSGLPRLPGNLKPRNAADPYLDYSATDLKEFIATWKATRPRDTKWEYSNLGFGLMGHALGLRAGKRFAELLRARVLEPLQIGEIQLALAGTNFDALLPGHDAQRRPVQHWHFDAIAGAGALVGSARSLARYAQAALGLVDTPLQAAFQLALAPRADGPGPINPIGLAWLRAPLNGRSVANHDGGTFGFSTSLWLDPERKRAALVLANAMVPVTDLALHALDASVPHQDGQKLRFVRE